MKAQWHADCTAGDMLSPDFFQTLGVWLLGGLAAGWAYAFYGQHAR